MKTWGRLPEVALLVCVVGTAACSDGGSDNGARDGGSSTGGERNTTCAAGASDGEVREPVFIANLPSQTSWYASPVIALLARRAHRKRPIARYSM